jgi:hypothetical protein
MADNSFEDTLVDFRRWADSTGRTLNGDRDTDAAELGILSGLIPDYLADDPARLAPGHLTALLLDVYPRKVTVLDREETADTIPAVRDLVIYLTDTGAIIPATARALERELDEIEPAFPDAVLNPANWGPATATMHAMHPRRELPSVVMREGRSRPGSA